MSIREYFEKDGEFLPTKKGISLTIENWEKLKTLINTVDECITKIWYYSFILKKKFFNGPIIRDCLRWTSKEVGIE